jgi:hypothetical protein
MTISYTRLPSEFIDLLKSNMNTRGDGYRKLKTLYWHSGSFKAVTSKCFSSIDKQGRFDRIIHSLGWLGFRDRLAASYIHYLQDGHFPDEPNVELINDILTLEDSLKPYTIDGHNRGFLIGFYLKVSRQSNGQAGALISKETLDLLDIGSSKLLSIDWLCLSLELMLKYKKYNYLKEALSSGANFRDLLFDLPDKEREGLMYDLTTYGASIEEQEMFFNRVV